MRVFVSIESATACPPYLVVKWRVGDHGDAFIDPFSSTAIRHSYCVLDFRPDTRTDVAAVFESCTDFVPAARST